MMSLAVSRVQSYMYDELTSIHVFKNIATQKLMSQLQS